MDSEKLKNDISLVLSLYSKGIILQEKIDNIKVKHQSELAELYSIGNIIEGNIYKTDVINNIMEYIKSCEISAYISTTTGCSKKNPRFPELIKEHQLKMENWEGSELNTIFDFGKHVYHYYYLDDIPDFDTIDAEFNLEIIDLKDEYITVKLFAKLGAYSDNLEFDYILETERVVEFFNKKVKKVKKVL